MCSISDDYDARMIYLYFVLNCTTMTTAIFRLVYYQVYFIIPGINEQIVFYLSSKGQLRLQPSINMDEAGWLRAAWYKLRSLDRIC